MVRAKLGKNVESLRTGEAVSEIRFNDRLGHATSTAAGSQAPSPGNSDGEAVRPRDEGKGSDV
ncbi:hypothetical protein VNI00_019074 [Paramarasmius palmivorus]|uniref:Uncharacterized protein n=1 Tax=Paramarasmius palmivorus TaxID=297713 RepID=A0AAW0AQA3_9AGAR